MMTEDPQEEYDCEEYGHKWRYVGCDEDGARLFRCPLCGKERID